MLSQLLRRMVECRRSCENRFQNKTAPSLCLRAMIVVFLLLALGPHVPLLTAQGLDAAALLKPATDTWPTYNGDYSGRRFSTLDRSMLETSPRLRSPGSSSLICPPSNLRLWK